MLYVHVIKHNIYIFYCTTTYFYLPKNNNLSSTTIHAHYLVYAYNINWPRLKESLKCNWWERNFALGVVGEWSKVLTTVPWPFMVWSTLALGTYQLRFVSWVFHVIFSFAHFISLYTLGGLRVFRKPLPYNMYLFNLRIANHILIKIKIKLSPSPFSINERWVCVALVTIF